MSPPRKTAARTESRSVRSEKPPPPTDDDAWVPERDSEAVGRVASRVQIKSVELVAANFERSDSQPLPSGSDPPMPELMIGLPEWAVDWQDNVLGALFTFGTRFPEQDDQPYQLVARFRLTYEVKDASELSDQDFKQFVFFNAMFNAWPYWREYLSSTVNRAGLPRFVAPVMGLPVRQSAAGRRG